VACYVLGQRGEPPKLTTVDAIIRCLVRGGTHFRGLPFGICSILVRRYRSIRKNFCCIVTSSVSNLTLRYLESNLSLRGEKPASNRLLNGAVWSVIHHCISDETDLCNWTLLSHGVSASEGFQLCSAGI